QGRSFHVAESGGRGEHFLGFVRIAHLHSYATEREERLAVRRIELRRFGIRGDGVGKPSRFFMTSAARYELVRTRKLGQRRRGPRRDLREPPDRVGARGGRRAEHDERDSNEKRSHREAP